MATKASAAKPPRRSNKPRAATAKSAQRPKSQRQPEVSALDSPPTLAEWVEVQRAQLLKAVSLVDCCKHASASLFETDDSEYMVPAFELVMDLLNASAGELERIARSVKRSTDSTTRSRRRGRRARADKEL